MDGIKAAFTQPLDPSLEERKQQREDEKKRLAKNILSIWRIQAKGPVISDEELATIRKRAACSEDLSPDEVRRLVQTIDAARLGFAHGILKDFPPLFSRVYEHGGWEDVFDGEVIAHLPNGRIRVKTMHGGEFVEETWSNWFNEEEFVEMFGEKPVRNW